MDKHRTRGTAKQIKGSVKAGFGKLTGNKSLELKGRVEKVAGKAQSGYGALKDEVRASKELARERKGGARSS
jgi:uncharacterized protein YjbJ (UPF0337 family)